MVFHNAVAVWGCFFFVLQVVFSDVVRFAFFLSGNKVKTLYELLNIQSPKIGSFRPFSYHGALVTMWLMYLFLLLGGFQPFYLLLKRKLVGGEDRVPATL